MSTKEDFGLGESLAKYLDMPFSELDHLVPLLRVPFGDDDTALRKLASKLLDDKRTGKSAEYVEHLIADARELRRQHQNLTRRRMAFHNHCCSHYSYYPAELSREQQEQALASFYKEHRRDFERTEAQVSNRRHDAEEAGLSFEMFEYCG